MQLPLHSSQPTLSAENGIVTREGLLEVLRAAVAPYAKIGPTPLIASPLLSPAEFGKREMATHGAYGR